MDHDLEFIIPLPGNLWKLIFLLDVLVWTTILHESALKLILYGPRIRIIFPILEILEIEVSNILYSPGNIGKLTLSMFSYPGNIGNLLFPVSDIVEMRAAGRRLQGLGSGGLGLFLESVPGIL